MKKQKLTLTNGELAGAYSALQNISPKVTGIVSRFRIAENVKSLDPQRATWATQYEEIVKDRAEHDDQGKPVIENDEYVWRDETGKSALIDLNKIEVEITFTPLSLDRLAEDIRKGVTFDYVELMPLLLLINDDVDTEKA